MITADVRFWAKVDKEGPLSEVRPDLGSCWLWQAQLDKHGYGYFWWGGRSQPAYRFSYLEAYGSIPAGLELDHLCRVRACIRPDHLEPVTHKENLRRGVGGANLVAINRGKTHCPAGHPYDLLNTRIDKNGHRSCRICTREHGRLNDLKRPSGWRRSKEREAIA